MTPAERRTTIINTARQRADRDVAQGIHDLQAAIQAAPEWTHTTHQGASRPSAIPARAMLQGMLNHLHKSFNQERQKAS